MMKPLKKFPVNKKITAKSLAEIKDKYLAKLIKNIRSEIGTSQDVRIFISERTRIYPNRSWEGATGYFSREMNPDFYRYDI